MARTRWAERIAYHEAGHAVSALVLGLRVEHVRLGPLRHGGQGAVVQLRAPRWFVVDFERWRRVRRLTPTRRRYIRAHIVNSLAGRAAECRHLIAYGREPSRSFVGSYDWDAVLRASFMAGKGRWRPSSLRREAERLIRENWDRVAAVAEALLERRMLSGAELRQLERVAPGARLCRRGQRASG